jgi:hypothetical protein
MGRGIWTRIPEPKANNVKEVDDPRWENVRKYAYIQKLRYVRNHNNQTIRYL